MRVFILRAFIGWWMIVFIWSFGWALDYLLFGYKAANDMAAEITKAVWYGDA